MELSVIVCAYNRGDFIGKTIQSLIDQDYPNDKYEVVIVDNNSTDHTEKVCREMINENPANHIIYIKEPKQGLSFARNRGIQASSAPLIAFIDDDAVANPHYVKKAIEAFRTHPDHVAGGGPVIPVYPSGEPPSWLSPTLNGIIAKVDRGKKFFTFKRKYPVGCNMIFRKSVFEEIGYFNTNIRYRGDEKFIFMKIKKKGWKFFYHPGIPVFHHIEEKRLFIDNVIKTSILVGKSERERLAGKSLISHLLKLAEYALKLILSIFLALFYLLQGERIKAKWIIGVRYHVLLGFIQPL